MHALALTAAGGDRKGGARAVSRGPDLSAESGAVEIAARLPEHEETLMRVARGLCRDEAAARDLVQETFVRALERGQGFEPGTKLRAWLVTILHHRFIDLCRRAKARPLHPDGGASGEQLAAPEPEPPPVWSAFDRDDLRRAAEKLPAELGAAYRLHAFDGLGYAEIAKRLSIPQNTVGTRLLRARKRLKQILEEAPR
jgi:RNA polymerase sigma-70 factor (ECF subfamily)